MSFYSIEDANTHWTSILYVSNLIVFGLSDHSFDLWWTCQKRGLDWYSSTSVPKNNSLQETSERLPLTGHSLLGYQLVVCKQLCSVCLMCLWSSSILVADTVGWIKKQQLSLIFLIFGFVLRLDETIPTVYHTIYLKVSKGCHNFFRCSVPPYKV